MEPRAPEASLAELDPALQLPQRRKMEILLAVLMVTFLSALDQTIVGVALPRIVGELGGTNELYTWAITSYLLTATITGVFYGKLSDIYGRRLMLLIGVSIFLLGSVAVSPVVVDDQPDHLPGHPGRRCRGHLPDLPGHHRRPLHAPRARPLPGSLRGRLRRRLHHRPAAGRLADGQPQLALDLPGQPAHRRSHAVHHLPLPALGPRRAPDAEPRLRRRPRVRRRCRLPPRGPDQQADRRVDRLLGRGLPR